MKLRVLIFGEVLCYERSGFEFWCDGGDSRLHDRFVF